MGRCRYEISPSMMFQEWTDERLTWIPFEHTNMCEAFDYDDPGIER